MLLHSSLFVTVCTEKPITKVTRALPRQPSRRILFGFGLPFRAEAKQRPGRSYEKN